MLQFVASVDMAVGVELSLHIYCWADVPGSVPQLMILEALSSACLQTAATLQIPHWSDKLGKPVLSFMHVLCNCLDYNLSNRFLFFFFMS